jgi:mRNA-degrading endonuclease RelE of RelBE toxin-antitoxin system
MFEVFLDIPAQTFLKEAGESIRSRTKEIFEELSLDPIPQGAKRIIQSQEKIFRLRSRHLRLLYRINYEKQTLVIIKIELLSRMYR